jgi:hypothetical protein
MDHRADIQQKKAELDSLVRCCIQQSQSKPVKTTVMKMLQHYGEKCTRDALCDIASELCDFRLTHRFRAIPKIFEHLEEHGDECIARLLVPGVPLWLVMKVERNRREKKEEELKRKKEKGASKAKAKALFCEEPELEEKQKVVENTEWEEWETVPDTPLFTTTWSPDDTGFTLSDDWHSYRPIWSDLE